MQQSAQRQALLDRACQRCSRLLDGRPAATPGCTLQAALSHQSLHAFRLQLIRRPRKRCSWPWMACNRRMPATLAKGSAFWAARRRLRNAQQQHLQLWLSRQQRKQQQYDKKRQCRQQQMERRRQVACKRTPGACMRVLVPALPCSQQRQENLLQAGQPHHLQPPWMLRRKPQSRCTSSTTGEQPPSRRRCQHPARLSAHPASRLLGPAMCVMMPGRRSTRLLRPVVLGLPTRVHPKPLFLRRSERYTRPATVDGQPPVQLRRWYMQDSVGRWHLAVDTLSWGGSAGTTYGAVRRSQGAPRGYAASRQPQVRCALVWHGEQASMASALRCLPGG